MEARAAARRPGGIGFQLRTRAMWEVRPWA